MPQRFTREQVDAILGRAVERDRSANDLTREQLVAIAAEIGVSEQSVDRAIQEVAAERKVQADRVRLRQQAWRGFLFHLVPYVCVNALLITINAFTTDFPWALFPAMGWGIGLLSHLLAVVFPNPDRIERLLQRERDRERRRELKRQLKMGATELESAVGQGVAALLHAAAGRLQDGGRTAPGEVRPRVNLNIESDPEESDELETPERQQHGNGSRAKRW